MNNADYSNCTTTGTGYDMSHLDDVTGWYASKDARFMIIQRPDNVEREASEAEALYILNNFKTTSRKLKKV